MSSPEVGQLLGVIGGAIRGRPDSKVTSEFRPSEFPKGFPPNPNAQTLLKELMGTAVLLKSTGYQNMSLLWSPEEVRLHRLFPVLIAFTDDHDRKISKEYFPVEESNRFIEAVISTSQEKGAPLNLLEQLSCALDITNRRLFSGLYLSHLASRAAGRNKDQRQGLIFSNTEMQRWSASIARFDNAKQYDPPGDTYHFWAASSMGFALGWNYKKNPIVCAAIGLLFYYGADITDKSKRLIAKKYLHFKHPEADRMGLYAGWNLGRYFAA